MLNKFDIFIILHAALTASLLSSALPLAAQHSHAIGRCGTTLMEAQHHARLDYRQAASVWESAYVAQEESKAANRQRMPRTLPVVLHYIHPVGTQVDTVVLEAVLDRLNEVLAGAVICQDDHPSPPVDVQLCPTHRTYQGEPTFWIRSVEAAQASYDLCTDDAQLKAMGQHERFPTTDYLHLYLVPEIHAACYTGGDQIAGYASLPPAHGFETDGIVLEQALWQMEDCQAHKVILHELGHYLGLHHTFRGGCANGDCLRDGDRVCDTPPDEDDSPWPDHPCARGGSINSCDSDVQSTDPNNPWVMDVPDLSDNLMDYAPLSCLSQWTAGQIRRMQHSLSTARAGLITSEGCHPPCMPDLELIIDWPGDTLGIGRETMVHHSSIGAHGYQWHWNDEVISDGSSVTLLPVVTGSYTLCLEAMDTLAGCSRQACRTLQAICDREVEVEWQMADDPQVGDTLIGRVRTDGPPITWVVDGTPVHLGDSFSYVLTDAAQHTLWAEGCDTTCCASSSPIHIRVAPCASGQEASQWIFGLEGVHLQWIDGQLMDIGRKEDFSSYEACPIAIDADGELLFYFDGDQLFDRQDNIMEGWEPHLAIASSSTHAITLRLPASDSIWYLFYPDEVKTSQPSRDSMTALHYVIIDMSGRDGYGRVISDELTLLQPSTEKVAAIRQCNGIDYWITAHEAGSDAYYTWPFTSVGLGSPVISHAGRYIDLLGSQKIGQVAYSPLGRQLASVTSNRSRFDGTGSIEVFDFDHDLGTQTYAYQVNDAGDRYYGVGFSSSGRYLYAPTIIAGPPRYGIILQYDLWAGDSTAVKASEREVFRTTEIRHFGLYFVSPGMDNKLYIGDPNDSSLCVIQAPDLPGYACRVDVRGVTLTSGESFVGLPTWPADIHAPDKAYIRGPVYVCDTTSRLNYHASAGCGYRDLRWSASPGLHLDTTAGGTVSLSSPSIGWHELYLTHTSACRTVIDTLRIEVVDCSVTSPCSFDVDVASLDLQPCGSAMATVELYTDADYLHYRLDSDMHPIVVQQGLIHVPLYEQLDTLRIFLTKSLCDTILVYPVSPADTLAYAIDQVDTSICLGDSARLRLVTDAPIQQLVSSDLQSAIDLPMGSDYHWFDLEDDTLSYIRLADTPSGCEVILPWYIRVDTPRAVIDTLYYCEGDSLYVFDDVLITHLSDTGRYERSAMSCMDTTRIRYVLAADAITYTYQIDTPCADALGQVVWQLPPEVRITWADGDSSDTKALLPGVYAVQLSLGSCHVSAEVTLPEWPAAEYEIAIRHQQCPTEADGEMHMISDDIIRWRIVGRSWTMGSAIEALAADTYPLELEDAHGCLIRDTVLIQPSKATLPMLEIQQPSCPSDLGIILVDSSHVDQVHIDGMLSLDTPISRYPGVYRLSLTDTAGCSWDTLVRIEEASPLAYTLSIVAPSCAGDADGYLKISAPTTYLWGLDTAIYDVNRVINQLSAGDYILAIRDSDRGCVILDTIALVDGPTLELDLPSDTFRFASSDVAAIDPEVYITGDPMSYLWMADLQLDCPDCATLLIPDGADGVYHLTISDGPCQRTDSLVVAFDHRSIYIPTAFHPAGVHNKTFGAYSATMSELVADMKVYGRWGQLIYHCRGDLSSCRWDGHAGGRALPSGTYAYQMQIIDPTTQRIITYYGEVMLMR